MGSPGQAPHKFDHLSFLPSLMTISLSNLFRNPRHLVASMFRRLRTAGKHTAANFPPITSPLSKCPDLLVGRPKTSAEQYHTTVMPPTTSGIKDLPPEILSQIFVWTGAFATPRYALSRSWLQGTERLISILHVCWVWYRVVQSTRDLWDTILVIYPWHEKHLNCVMGYVRSLKAKRLFRVMIDAGYRDTYPSNGSGCLSELLTQLLPRCYELNDFCGWLGDDMRLDALEAAELQIILLSPRQLLSPKEPSPAIAPRHFPKLRVLMFRPVLSGSFQTQRTDSPEDTYVDIPLFGTPSLVKLVYTGIRIPLRTFSAQCQLSTELTNMELTDVTWYRDPYQMDLNPYELARQYVNLPQLQRLSIVSWEDKVYHEAFSSVMLGVIISESPSLDHLKIGYQDIFTPQTRHYFSVSLSSTLNSMEILLDHRICQDEMENGSGMVDSKRVLCWLESFPNLQHLQLTLRVGIDCTSLLEEIYYQQHHSSQFPPICHPLCSKQPSTQQYC
jgi:hypothetical protein